MAKGAAKRTGETGRPERARTVEETLAALLRSPVKVRAGGLTPDEQALNLMLLVPDADLRAKYAHRFGQAALQAHLKDVLAYQRREAKHPFSSVEDQD